MSLFITKPEPPKQGKAKKKVFHLPLLQAGIFTLPMLHQLPKVQVDIPDRNGLQ
jgi:hypothetical protein